jgi:membrane-associated phospholipid phosphatase
MLPSPAGDASESGWFYERRVGEVLLGVAFVLVGFVISLFQHEQVIPLHDPAIDYPIRLNGNWYTAETMNTTCATDQKLCDEIKAATPWAQVPNWALIVISFSVPLVLFSVHWILQKKGSRWVRGTSKDRNPFLGLFVCFSSTYGITAWLKATVGRPRPIFYALREHAMLKAGAGGTPKYGDAYCSFPSGHSSVSMCCLFFTTLWLLSLLADTLPNNADKRSRRSVLSSTVLTFASFLPCLLSLWIASTRVEDYWHNYSDILFGLLIGVPCALISFRTVYEESAFMLTNKASTQLLLSHDVERGHIALDTNAPPQVDNKTDGNI